MSRVVNNNLLGFLQLLTCYPDHQRQFLVKTATPQQIHALVQIIYNLLTENIAISGEDRRKVITYKDALGNLAEPITPYRKRKQILVQEGDPNPDQR